MSAPPAPEPTALLHHAGLRATAPRLAVLRALAPLHHATADELAEQVADLGVAPSTVYRTLEHLERAGVVSQVLLAAGRRSYYLTDTAAHLHLRCVRCGRLETADVRLLRALSRSVEKATGFVLDTEHPVLSGHCRDCARDFRPATDR